MPRLSRDGRARPTGKIHAGDFLRDFDVAGKRRDVAEEAGTVTGKSGADAERGSLSGNFRLPTVQREDTRYCGSTCRVRASRARRKDHPPVDELRRRWAWSRTPTATRSWVLLNLKKQLIELAIRRGHADSQRDEAKRVLQIRTDLYEFYDRRNSRRITDLRNQIRELGAEPRETVFEADGER